ncbi:ABC transporter ATP-binding protein [Methanospirillum stamsii]|uniref:ABC transporter ATP-binding protein n=1 Tax=Methanospirillum stamsii TaxID=1277351 RepID=A0A2V2N467_9EURY|nr:ABC transporter ATP-binding protein [Methanospirillum stamsii]PWR74619.1 ABC transporter ATP-binding protein [Methanospirillum stamsii]
MIEASSLSKQYGDMYALSDVSFTCREGEIFGIIGHNGAGKTTLLKILSGLILPSSGSLVIGNLDLISDPMQVRSQIGYLPEESRLYETMLVPDYLSFFGEIYGLDKTTIRARADLLLAQLSLQPEEKRIGNLSKGMKRKVAIARSLIHDPSILIYDEPGSGLDPMTTRFIIEYLKQLRMQGKTIILSAHNLAQVEEICDHVMILKRGKVIVYGTMPELREQFGSIRYEIWYIYPENQTPEIAAELNGNLWMSVAHSIEELNIMTGTITTNGGTVERIESRYPSLEEILVKIGK